MEERIERKRLGQPQTAPKTPVLEREPAFFLGGTSAHSVFGVAIKPCGDVLVSFVWFCSFPPIRTIGRRNQLDFNGARYYAIVMLNWKRCFRKRTRASLVGAMVALVGLLSGATASQINWRSLANLVNVTSIGAPLTGEFLFELGTFKNGFEPTAQNTAEWAAHWYSVGRSAYRESTHLFSGSFTVTSNAAPLTLGGKAYIWGYNAGASTLEWILIRKTDWTWPAPSALALPRSWIVSGEMEAVLGSVSAVTGEYLRTAAVSGGALVPIPIWRPTEWLQEAFTTEQQAIPAISAWENDPDGDSMSNQVEYLMGTMPMVRDVNLPLEMLPIDDGEGTYRLRLTRQSDRLGELFVEASRDARNWGQANSGYGLRETLNTMHFQELILTSSAPSPTFFRVTARWIEALEP